MKKGRVGTRTWCVDDDSAAKRDRFEVDDEELGVGCDMAIGISVSQPTTSHVRAYVTSGFTPCGQDHLMLCQQDPGTRRISLRLMSIEGAEVRN